MRHFAWIISLGLAFAVACGDGNDDDDDDDDVVVGDTEKDAGPPGVCRLSDCPAPETGGVACCTPTGRCGMDPLGSGFNCVPNAGDPLTDNVCILKDCPLPTMGNRCCTPSGTCGTDPFGTGLACFANPPEDRTEPSNEPPTCPIDDCPLPASGFSCCTPDGRCGTDPWGMNICYANPEPSDAGPVEFPSLTPPEDPSVTGECPSYLGTAGPVWGCCASVGQNGLCGTFAFDACLLPVGTPLPVGPPPEEDAGVSEPFLRCTPPVAD